MSVEPIPLGQLLTGSEQRDAVHVAIFPATANYKLSPGQDVGIIEPGVVPVVGSVEVEPVGIVDPFLKSMVFPEQMFYVALYPNTITSLRHDWVHPAFDAVPSKEESRRWMEEFAAKHHSHKNEWYHGTGRDYTADEVIESAADYLATGERHVQPGSESLRDFEFPLEFWKHFEALSGSQVSDSDKERMPFCCTC